jgi:hypothetical protein
MPDLPTNVLSSLIQVPHEARMAQAYLQPVDLAPNETPPWSLTEEGSAIAFQYWPESIQDSKGSEWNPRNIPGGSHPIYQWTHGGERRISFTAVFMTDTAPEERLLEFTDGLFEASFTKQNFSSPYSVQADVPLNGLELGKRDVDLRSVVSRLRWFTYPTYGSEPNDLRVYEPAKCLLVLPHTRLGYNGEDHVTCVMTQCDVTYEAWFPSGFPRIIEVALEFAEVVQSSQQVRFHDRKSMVVSQAIQHFLSLRESSHG